MTELALAVRPAAEVARATIAHHSKSFALASRLLGARTRDDTAVVYTRCRRADDAIDAPERLGSGETALARLRAELDGVYDGSARDPVLAAFSRVVRARTIPRRYPDELLAGMAMDVADTRYATLGDLTLYCWRVAGVVGLMMSHVFGVFDDRALQRAAHLGIAMQLTNICRDVAEDWSRRRLYVPAELLAAHGAPGLEDELGGPLPRSAVPALGGAVREMLAIADAYYRSGDRGISALPWRAALGVRAARGVYSAIGARIASAGHDVTAGRAVVSSPRKLAEVVRAALGIGASAPARVLRAIAGRRAQAPTLELEHGDLDAV